MYLSRVQIQNFRNFANLDVRLHKNVVMLGENRVGKSNFIFALRLVLDTTLPDAARQLKLADIWDGCDLDSTPEIHIDLDFVDFETDAGLLALLTDCRISSDHTIARLSYLFRKKIDVPGTPTSDADYEFVAYAGGNETRWIKPELRRRICLDLLHALRDAEADLGSWRTSPLRVLIEDAISQVPKNELSAIAEDLIQATTKLSGLRHVKDLEADLRKDIADLSGASQDIKVKLGFVPVDQSRLFRSIVMLIDDGKRSIAEASLGSANIALLALKQSEFAWRRRKNQRNYTLLCIEEPEAHLHPHLQRRVFQKFFADDDDAAQGLFLTTHSPNIASVAPLMSIVLLKSSANAGTRGFSLAELSLGSEDLEDLQRYLNATRAEILFARGVIFVEGDAEEALVPVFAKNCDYDLDELGITVCSVGGVNFGPYVRLAMALDLPFVVITDWDPQGPQKPPLGRERTLDLMDDMLGAKGKSLLNAKQRAIFESDEIGFRNKVQSAHIFLNGSTLETEIAESPQLSGPLLSVLESEGFGTTRRQRLARWKDDPTTVNGEQLLAMVADIGKGRLSSRLAERVSGLKPPDYIADAVRDVATRV